MTSRLDHDDDGLPDERRATRRALTGWDRAYRDGQSPNLTTLIDWLQSDGWSNQVLLRCDPDPESGVVLMAGRGAEHWFGGRAIGATPEAIMHHGLRQCLFIACRRAISTLAPIEVESTDVEVGEARVLALPLVDPDGTARYLWCTLTGHEKI